MPCRLNSRSTAASHPFKPRSGVGSLFGSEASAASSVLDTHSPNFTETKGIWSRPLTVVAQRSFTEDWPEILPPTLTKGPAPRSRFPSWPLLSATPASPPKVK